MSAIWVEISETRGSTPRDVGTAMKVTPSGTEGTIGGGALEYEAIALAREMLAGDRRDDLSRRFALGPGLGQCCGGAVALRFTRIPCAVDTVENEVVSPASSQIPPRHLWLWGAGHVGRAIVATAPMTTFQITWADTDRTRFPSKVPEHVTAVPAACLPLLATKAPTNSHHLILTYSHDIDFDLCAALLKRGVRSIGLIGSNTKRARFFKRLRALGLDPSPIECPIGDKSLGKRPDQIALGVLQSLMQEVAA